MNLRELFNCFSETQTEVLPAGTPGPMTATLMFLDAADQTVTTTSIGAYSVDYLSIVIQRTASGEEIILAVKSDGAGPNNMMLMDCTATRVGGNGDSVPFRVIDNGYMSCKVQ